MSVLVYYFNNMIFELIAWFEVHVSFLFSPQFMHVVFHALQDGNGQYRLPVVCSIRSPVIPVEKVNEKISSSTSDDELRASGLTLEGTCICIDNATQYSTLSLLHILCLQSEVVQYIFKSMAKMHHLKPYQSKPVQLI